MPTQSPLSSELRERYEAESARLQRDFSTNNDGLKYLQERSALVDSMARRFWEQLAAASGVEPSHIVFAAVGDLGRQTLFPYSEIDFVFLAATGEAAQKFKDAIQRLTQGMSEIGLKANSTTRIISEFAQLESENTEAILSLLDCRFLGGDEELFASLRSRAHSRRHGPRVPRPCRAPGGINAQHPTQVREHGLPPGAEREGRSGRISGLRYGALACCHVCDGEARRLARSTNLFFTREPGGYGFRAAFLRFRALLPALPE